MNKKKSADDPADRIINRYMPNATPEQRDEARENLHNLAKLLLRIETRMAKEWWEWEGKQQHEQAQSESSNPTTVSDPPTLQDASTAT